MRGAGRTGTLVAALVAGRGPPVGGRPVEEHVHQIEPRRSPSLAWVILLAGGDGSRVRGLTRDEQGALAPKQFCCLEGGRTLFQRALDRARTVTCDSRVVPVVQSSHRLWWEREVRGIPRQNVLVEPRNRGTAVAILRALRHIRARDMDAIVVVLPSDHGAENEAVLCESIARAAEAAAQWARHVILVGMDAVDVDADYGWILPAAGSGVGTAAVSGFHEKPSREAARRLASAGAVINTFIFAATASALEHLFRIALPELGHARDLDLEPGGHFRNSDRRRRFLSRIHS